MPSEHLSDGILGLGWSEYEKYEIKNDDKDDYAGKHKEEIHGKKKFKQRIKHGTPKIG